MTTKKPNFREILVGALVYVKSKSFLAFKDLLQAFLRHIFVSEEFMKRKAITKSRDVSISF